MSIERLDFESYTEYNAIEASIHINRYLTAKPFCAGKKVLDATCGEGYGSHLITKWGAESVVGLDISDEAIEKANKFFSSPEIQFIKQDIEDLSRFEDGFFDLVVSMESIEHLHHPEKFLEEIKRVAKKDAVIIISCPNDHYYYTLPGQGNEFHLRRYTQKEFDELTQAVLGVKAASYFGTGIDGYVNTLCAADEKVANTQKQMLDFFEPDETIQVMPQEILKQSDACYYINIWGPVKPIQSTIAFHASSRMKKTDDNLWASWKRDDDLQFWLSKANANVETMQATIDKANANAEANAEAMQTAIDKANANVETMQATIDKANACANFLGKELDIKEGMYNSIFTEYCLYKKVQEDKINLLKSTNIELEKTRIALEQKNKVLKIINLELEEQEESLEEQKESLEEQKESLEEQNKSLSKDRDILDLTLCQIMNSKGYKLIKFPIRILDKLRGLK